MPVNEETGLDGESERQIEFRIRQANLTKSEAEIQKLIKAEKDKSARVRSTREAFGLKLNR